MSASGLILPAHWLFNAGMLGLLQVLEVEGGIEPIQRKLLLPGGAVNGKRLYAVLRNALRRPAGLPKEIEGLRMLHWWYIQHEVRLNGPARVNEKAPFTSSEGKTYYGITGRLFGNNGDYQNLFHHSDREKVETFAYRFGESEIFQVERGTICPISGLRDFQLVEVEFRWLKWIFPTFSKFPNAFRHGSEKGTLLLSKPALYSLLFHHFALTSISKQQVFINAPSFEVMYHLNRFLRAAFGSSLQPQELLAVSMLHYTLRIQRMLSAWTYQNIELITKQQDKVESFTLPVDVARLLVDPHVARLLSRIRDSEVLRLVLARRFAEIEPVSYT
ncbi:MAG: hypothetical protein N2170_09770, partial [Bacteroidia bacterium]|nr:hypothetical protein [Bacteroidia bacterium]